MIKALHCGDIHLGDLNGPIRDGKNARREDTLDCMRAIVLTAEMEKPDITIIAGDLFNRSRVYADTALEDIEDAIKKFIVPLCRASGQAVLLFGTANHDNPRAFEVIRNTTMSETNLHIYTGPAIETLRTPAGEVQVMAMPGFDKGRLRVFMPDTDAETENQNATTLVNEIIMGLAAKADPDKPSILTAHYTVAGCESDNRQVFLAGQDVCILPPTIDAAGATLACLGHIHNPQRLQCRTPAFYCGSPNGLTFNDEGLRHGFWIHEIADDRSVESRYVETPAREHHTMRLDQESIRAFIETGELPDMDEKARDAIVRVRFDASPELEKQLNKAALQACLMKPETFGAFHVAEITRNETDEALTTDGAAAEDTPEAALHRYLETSRDGGKELTEADIKRIEGLAAPIIRQADDGRDAGRHTGAFTPKRIEVTNYRSYSHAEFGFDEIRMAMVNGENGAGKSSLFMDAIADCLYEQSRDGAVGEWVRQGEAKGSIIFEFEMGGTDWRVARTRTRSKGTLSLQRRDAGGEWQNESDTTMPLTQKRIVQTIGMDCQTFCSIALIRQDAYGIFLEADADRRMEVLSTLLNLGVYTRAEEMAKARATEQRRALASLNDRMEVLRKQIDERGLIEAELKECEAGQAMRAAQAKSLESEIQAAEREETLRQEMARQASEKEKEALSLKAQAEEKDRELAGREAEMRNESANAALLPKANEADRAVNEARAELETLAEDESRLKALLAKEDLLKGTIHTAENDLALIKGKITAAQVTIENRSQIEEAVKEMEAIRAAREGLNPKIAEHAEASKAAADLKKEATELIAESRIRIGDLTRRIEGARKKTEMLTSSGCPIVDDATCEFLKDAKAAKAELEALEPQLAEMKRKDKASYEEIQARLKEAQARLDGLGDPMAESQALTERERKASVLATHAGRLEAAVATLGQLDSQKAEKESVLEKARTDLAEAEAEIAPLARKSLRAAELRETIKREEPTAKLKSQCAAAEATVKALEVAVGILKKDAENRRHKADEAMLEALKMKERIPQPNGSLDRLRERKEAISKESEDAAKRIGNLQGRIEAIEDARDQWEAYKGEKAAAARALNDYQTLAGAFGMDGIQYVIIRSIVPEIQDRANAILSAMTGGRMAVDFRTERENTSKKIVNTLDVWINSLSGGSRPYMSHSGGEKVKAALAVTLGLADVKARRAGVQLGMLWIDEPPFLDQDGTDAYADALAAMAARNPDMRILAISHDPQMKARFPQNITVAAGEGGSTVTAEL